MDLNTAVASFRQHLPNLERKGAYMHGARAYIPEGWKDDFRLGLDHLPRFGFDAQPTSVTEANSAVPMMLTTFIDPTVYKILFAANNAAKIFGEERKGNWLDETAMFPVVEHGGEVSSYGDYSENGHATANTNWPQRQSYLFQIIKEYGEREMERAGLARLNWTSELDQASATIMNKFLNLSYFYGTSGLQQYGLLNDPNLSAAITPATKAAGGKTWITGTVMNATANEVYADIQALVQTLINQSQGLIAQDSNMTLAMSPARQIALSITNTFNVNVWDLLKKNFPNLKLITAVQYGATSASNPQGAAAGETVQLIADDVDGQDTGYCSFNEKMRSHPLIRGLSSFKQKATGGTWGAIIRMPMSFATMVGV